MNKHPFSVWTLGGIPSGQHGVPSPADLASWGATWRHASDEYLIGIAARAYGQNSETATMPALLESQRRLMTAIATFEESAGTSADRLANVQTQLLTAIETSGDCASQQTAEVIKLTRALRFLTWALVGVGILQVLLMIWK